MTGKGAMLSRIRTHTPRPIVFAAVIVLLLSSVQAVRGGNIASQRPRAHTDANTPQTSNHTNGGDGNVSGYAWGANVGWVNFDPTGGGVSVYSDHLEGYAWAENIGWIRLGSYAGGGAHSYLNTAADDYGVNNDGSGNLSGLAWSTTSGWINFDPDGDEQVTVNTTTGEFDGYAWGENVGWIHFRGTAADSTAYGVVTSYTPTVVELADFTATAADDGIRLDWETATEIDCLGFNVYRSGSAEGARTQLNAALIPCQDPGSPFGGAYSFPDETAEPGVTYYYWLEAEHTGGRIAQYGPVQVTWWSRPHHAYLPLVY